MERRQSEILALRQPLADSREGIDKNGTTQTTGPDSMAFFEICTFHKGENDSLTGFLPGIRKKKLEIQISLPEILLGWIYFKINMSPK